MKFGLFSVSYAGLWGQHQLDLPDFVARAARLGYDTVMLAGKRPHLSPLDASVHLVESIRAALEQNSITCCAVAAYNDLSPALATEVPYLEMQIAYIESLARLAAELGASIVRIFTAYETENDLRQGWERSVKAIREVCDRTAPHGVTVAMQNHHDLAVHTDALLELLQDVNRPNCALGFDAWSPALRGEDLYKSARRAAPYTVMTTNADYIRLPRFRYRPELVNYEQLRPDYVRGVKFGTGFVDYPAFFCGLKDGGFDGYFNYEMCSPLRGGGMCENLDEYAAHYVQWMRENYPDRLTQKPPESC